jgi:MFS family permease
MNTTITEPQRKPRSFFLTSLPFFIVAHAAHHILTAFPTPLLPYFRDEFHLDMAKSAVITSSFALPAGASQLPSGWLADRIGPTILITIDIVGVAIAGFLVGLSQTYLMLLIFLALMGLASGGYHPAATPLISMSVPQKQRGRALGFHLIGGNSSFFLAPMIAVGIASTSSLGWRGPFIYLAIPVAVLGLLFFVYLKRRFGRARVEAMKRQQTQDHPTQSGYKRRLIAFLVMMFIGGGASASVGTLLPLYLTSGLGASNAVGSGLALTIVYSSGLWAGPAGGYLCDRIGSVKVIIATGLVSAMVMFLLRSVELGMGLWLTLWVMGLNQAVRFPVTEVFIMSQAPAKNRSTIYGVYYSTMQYTGSIFGPIMGFIIDRLEVTHGGYEAAFKMMFNYSAWTVLAVAIVTALFIWDARD